MRIQPRYLRRPHSIAGELLSAIACAMDLAAAKARPACQAERRGGKLLDRLANVASPGVQLSWHRTELTPAQSAPAGEMQQSVAIYSVPRLIVSQVPLIVEIDPPLALEPLLFQHVDALFLGGVALRLLVRQSLYHVLKRHVQRRNQHPLPLSIQLV